MSESKHFGPCDGFGYNGACSMCTGLVEPIATPTPPQVTMGDYEYVPDDENLASALDTAERLAKEADAKFCAAFGGDGETSAYWLTQAIAEIRVALAHPTIPTPPQGAVDYEAAVRMARDIATVSAVFPNATASSEFSHNANLARAFLALHERDRGTATEAMVEAVAKELFDYSERVFRENLRITWSAATDTAKDHYRHQARRALTAALAARDGEGA